jgi:hypothetical protein
LSGEQRRYQLKFACSFFPQISVQTNVDKLVRDMERAIAQADAFIASLQAE